MKRLSVAAIPYLFAGMRDYEMIKFTHPFRSGSIKNEFTKRMNRKPYYKRHKNKK